MPRTIRACAITVLTALVALSGSFITPEPARASSSAIASAVSWLRTQQQPDGGFEVAGFPGFETPDAVFALAAAAQSGATWSASAARAAVLGTTTAAGKTPLHALDALVTGGVSKGQAAKVIVLATNPLGLDPKAFDPAGDGATDLVAILGAPGADHKFGISLAALNDIAYAVRAYAIVGTVPSETVAVFRNAQKSDGSWAFNGDATEADGGADTTAAVVLALLAAGVDATDDDVDSALDYLEAQQQGNGSWTDGYAENPNSTAIAMLALHAAGRTAPLAVGDAYLVGQQQPDGHVAGPYDGDYGLNTFGTAQAVEALARASVPVAASPVSTVTVPAAGGSGALSLETSAGTLAGVAGVDPGTLGAAPAGTSFPSGAVAFSVIGIDPGATVTVRVIFPVGTSATRYLKFHDGAWFDAGAAASVAGNVVTLTLTDGGALDDDGAANGVIVDPGGPASVTATAVVVTAVPRFAG
jgi:hypothetical protein